MLALLPVLIQVYQGRWLTRTFFAEVRLGSYAPIFLEREGCLMISRVRWGILGTATIAREAVLPAMLSPPHHALADVVAIASRDLSRARALAAASGVPRAYGSYEELLADPAIDAVYIPLPNHSHVPWSVRALEAGKHVLCEKPIARSAAEAEKLVEATRRFPHQKVMEAFMYRHHPQWAWARKIVEEGRIGRLRTIQSYFSFFDDNPASILHHAEWGGGALLDIGCYSVSLSRFLFQDEPQRIVGSMDVDPRFGVDRRTSGILEFPTGTATFTCSTCTSPQQWVRIEGEHGTVQLDAPFNPPSHQLSHAWLELADSSRYEEVFPACDQYGLQADHFARAISSDGQVLASLTDSVANLRACDALARSAASGMWERP